MVAGDALPRASHSGQGPTEGTAGHGASGAAWHQLSDCTAREGLGTQWASNTLPVLTRAPRALQILVAMNTGGQGWGGDGPHRWQERRVDGPGARQLQDSQDFCVETRERSSGQTLVTTVPSQPRTAATVSQQEGPGLTPKHWGWGMSLPGCLSQHWLRETGTGDGDVPQGAGAMSSFDSSAAAGAPRGSGSVAPSRIEGTSTALWGGDVPSPTDTETLMFELKNKH